MVITLGCEVAKRRKSHLKISFHRYQLHHIRDVLAAGKKRSVDQAQESAHLGGGEEDIKRRSHQTIFDFHHQQTTSRINNREPFPEASEPVRGQSHPLSFLSSFSSSQDEVPDPPSSLYRGRRVRRRHRLRTRLNASSTRLLPGRMSKLLPPSSTAAVRSWNSWLMASLREH